METRYVTRRPWNSLARASDPETSHEAAASVNLRRSQLAVLTELYLGPGTDQELFERLRARCVLITESGARTRRKELCRLGLVEDSGQRGLTNTGRRSIVWRITPAGRLEAER